MKCRHCHSEAELSLIDLGSAPPSNAYLNEQALREPEKWFPLRVLVCEHCWLVQTEDFTAATELFRDDYAYFSSFSSSWLAHSERYVADMAPRFNLDDQSHVVEVGANDGYLLQYFKARGIPSTGVEPTTGTASAARARGIDIVQEFFGVRLADQLAAEGKEADLIVANNVLAHVQDINDFVAGFAVLLKPRGVATFEFPHLLKLIVENQFDTIYHEHYSYLSFTTASRVLAANGLGVFDVEEYPTHGGSLRVFAQRADVAERPVTDRVETLFRREKEAGMSTPAFYAGFQSRAERVRDDFVTFLIDAKRQGRKVAAYGAAAKGNTLLNFAGVRPDLIPYVVDRNPAKQGKYMPGSRIPILAPAVMAERLPDCVVILPWNIAPEVRKECAWLADRGARFVTTVPKVEIL